MPTLRPDLPATLVNTEAMLLIFRGQEGFLLRMERDAGAPPGTVREKRDALFFCVQVLSGQIEFEV